MIIRDATASTASATGDTLTGNGGQDTFVYRKGNVGKDTITDFTLGTAGNADADKLNFADVLQGYELANIADFVRLEADATTGQVSVRVDYNGKADGSVFTPYLQVDLTGVTLTASDSAYGTTQADLDALRAAMMSNAQLILVKPGGYGRCPYLTPCTTPRPIGRGVGRGGTLSQKRVPRVAISPT